MYIVRKMSERERKNRDRGKNLITKGEFLNISDRENNDRLKGKKKYFYH